MRSCDACERDRPTGVRKPPSPNQGVVLGYLRALGGRATVREVFESQDRWASSTIRDHLNVLMSKGWVRKRGPVYEEAK